MNTSMNKRLCAPLTILLVTLAAVPALAAPSAPAVRMPGKPSIVVSSQPTMAKPAGREAIPTSAPKQEPKTQTSSPAAAPKQNTIPAVSNNPAPAADKTAPAPKEAKPAAAKEKPSAEQKKARQQEADAVVPGHPFRIQNKEENYKSQLSKAATKKLDATLANMIGGAEDKVPGLAVIVFKDGKEVYRNMMGNCFLSPRNPNWNLPLTADSRFRVASISKIFTAAGYLKLVEEGKIKLDEDVSRYLGFTLRNPRFPNKVITSRMLLSHTSSIRDYPTAYVPFKSSLKSFFTGNNCWSTDTQPPGVYFCYSNLNYILLGTIIEKVTGQRFDKYMNKTVLGPLNIKGSFNLRDLDSAELQKMGTLYRKTKGAGQPYQAQIDDRPIELPDASRLAGYRPGTNAGIFSPQGGLRVSPNELTHMLQMLMNKGKYQGRQILSPATYKLMTGQIWQYDPLTHNGDIEYSAIESYGMPIQLFKGNGETRPVPNRPGFHLYGHLGEAYGFIGGLMWQPETQNGFIFLQNGCASSEKYNPGNYSLNNRWEENFMKAIIDTVFPYDNKEFKSF